MTAEKVLGEYLGFRIMVQSILDVRLTSVSEKLRLLRHLMEEKAISKGDDFK